MRENIAFEKDRGMTFGAESTRAFTLPLLFDMGEIDAVIAGVDEFGLEEWGDMFASLIVVAVQARVSTLGEGKTLICSFGSRTPHV